MTGAEQELRILVTSALASWDLLGSTAGLRDRLLGQKSSINVTMNVSLPSGHFISNQVLRLCTLIFGI